jgi:hypothetical protein|tara:strand:+ start:394 stop:939 length:546 start_codon:yes stop_codon:yes gene_type:complete
MTEGTLTIERDMFIHGIDVFEAPRPKGHPGPPEMRPVMPMLMLCSSIEEIDEEGALTVAAVLLEQLAWIPECSEENWDSCGRECIDNAITDFVAAVDGGMGYGIWIPRDEDERPERIVLSKLSGEMDEDEPYRPLCERLSFSRMDPGALEAVPHLEAGLRIACASLMNHHWHEKLPSTIDE